MSTVFQTASKVMLSGVTRRVRPVGKVVGAVERIIKIVKF